MNLKNLIVPSKKTVAEYPGMEGFEVTLAYLTREELSKLRKKVVTTKLNKRTRQPEEEFDAELFQELYIKSIIKDWKGFKLKYAAKLLPIEISADADMEAEVEFTEDNALALVKNSQDFDAWVTEVIDDVQNFTKNN
jgi:hypothetical protein